MTRYHSVSLKVLRCLVFGAFFAPTALYSGIASANEETASDLARRAFFNLYAEDYFQSIEMMTYPPGGRGVDRKIQIVRKQSSGLGKVLIRLVEPSYVRGVSLLIIENETSVDDIYVYIPASRITRHLTSSQKSDAFFGTDLAYEDLEPKSVDDFEVRLLGSCSSGDRRNELVEIKPRLGANSGYERMISCIESIRGILLWTEFYFKGAVIKRLDVEVESVQEIGKRFVPFKMTMRDLRRGSLTTIETEVYEVAAEIPEKLFSTRNLEVGNARRDRAAIEEEQDESRGSD